MSDDGWMVTFTVPFVVDEWPGVLTIRLPDHMAAALFDDEIESALFSEYVRANGDEAFCEASTP